MGKVASYARYIDADAVGLFHPTQVVAPFSAYNLSGNYTVWKPQTATAKGLRIRSNLADSMPCIEMGTDGSFALQAKVNTDVIAYTTGTGRFKYGTHNATGDTVSDGHIEIKDSGGTTRKLMTTA